MDVPVSEKTGSDVSSTIPTFASAPQFSAKKEKEETIEIPADDDGEVEALPSTTLTFPEDIRSEPLAMHTDKNLEIEHASTPAPPVKCILDMSWPIPNAPASQSGGLQVLEAMDQAKAKAATDTNNANKVENSEVAVGKLIDLDLSLPILPVEAQPSEETIDRAEIGNDLTDGDVGLEIMDVSISEETGLEVSSPIPNAPASQSGGPQVLEAMDQAKTNAATDTNNANKVENSEVAVGKLIDLDLSQPILPVEAQPSEETIDRAEIGNDLTDADVGLEIIDVSISEETGLEVSWTIPTSEFNSSPSKRASPSPRKSMAPRWPKHLKKQGFETEANETQGAGRRNLEADTWNPFASDESYVPVMKRPPVATLESIRRMVEELFTFTWSPPSSASKEKTKPKTPEHSNGKIQQREKAEAECDKFKPQISRVRDSTGSPKKEDTEFRTPPRRALNSPRTFHKADLTFDKEETRKTPTGCEKSSSSPCFKSTPVRANHESPASTASATLTTSCTRLSFTSSSSNSSIDSHSRKKLVMAPAPRNGVGAFKIGDKRPAASAGLTKPQPFSTRLKLDSKSAAAPAAGAGRLQPMKATLSSDFAIKARAEVAVKNEANAKVNGGRFVCASAPVQRKFTSPIAASSPKPGARPAGHNSTFSDQNANASFTLGSTPSKKRYSTVKSSGYGRPQQPPPSLNSTKVLESPSKRVSAPNLTRPILKSPIMDRRSESVAVVRVEEKLSWPEDKKATKPPPAAARGVSNKENNPSIPRLVNRFGFGFRN